MDLAEPVEVNTELECFCESNALNTLEFNPGENIENDPHPIRIRARCTDERTYFVTILLPAELAGNDQTRPDVISMECNP